MLAKYFVVETDAFRCLLCPHACLLREGQAGLCGVRKAGCDGIFSLNHGKISAIQTDPVEKKPLYHFMPGTWTYSVGSFGCNLRCPFCQNYHIAKEIPATSTMTSYEVVNNARKKGLPSISFTYNEPIVSYEFVLETAKLAQLNGLSTIMVTNGYINQEPLKELLPYIDAMNIDLKAFREDSYKKICGGSLKPVMDTIEESVKSCHVEITTLLVTGMHTKGELLEMVKWLSSISKEIPLHVSRYFPHYQYHEPATPVNYLREIRDMASKYLTYVHAGNV